MTPRDIARRHRLTALGNAIVPQVAFRFLLAIAAADQLLYPTEGR